MKDLIRQIRTYLNLSQTEFAEKLNVTFQTVNRWENGHVVPNKLAQTGLFEFCMKNKVPVYEMTLNRISSETAKIKVPKGHILLYHGSKDGIKGKITPSSRKQCDFGSGFYMGTDISQALTLICDFEKSKMYIVSVNMKGLNKKEVAADISWALLVAYNRGKMEAVRGTSLYEQYRKMTYKKDLVIGNIADDRMFYVIDNFFLGNITDAALVGSLSALKLGKQYVAVSQKACDAVRIEKEIELSYIEKLFLKEKAEENRIIAYVKASDICRDFRREGKYFDEILAEEGK